MCNQRQKQRTQETKIDSNHWQQLWQELRLPDTLNDSDGIMKTYYEENKFSLTFFNEFWRKSLKKEFKLQNTGPLIYISLNHKSAYCVFPLSLVLQKILTHLKQELWSGPAFCKEGYFKPLESGQWRRKEYALQSIDQHATHRHDYWINIWVTRTKEHINCGRGPANADVFSLANSAGRISGKRISGYRLCPWCMWRQEIRHLSRRVVLLHFVLYVCSRFIGNACVWRTCLRIYEILVELETIAFMSVSLNRIF